MAFETDIFTNCDGLFYCIADWLNAVTQGYFWSIILIAFGIVLFMGTFNFGTPRAYGYSTIATAFLSLIFIQMGLIPTDIFTLILIAAGIGIVVMIISKS